MKLWCLIIVMSLLCPMLGTAAEPINNGEWFLIDKVTLEDARKTGDFSIVFSDYFMPSLNDNLLGLLLFGAELNLSNGRLEDYYGERHMFGKLVNSEAILAMSTYERMEYVDFVYEEVYRLLFGPWHIGGPKIRDDRRTIMEVRRPKHGKTLSLIDGSWRKNIGDWGIRIEHYTEFYGNLRVRWLTLDYYSVDETTYSCRISILR